MAMMAPRALKRQLTPIKAPRPERIADVTPERLSKEPRRVGTSVGKEAPDALAPHLGKASIAKADPAICFDAPVEIAAVKALFRSLESVLVYASSRKNRLELKTIRQDVENSCGKALSDSRLGCILALVGPSVLSVRWAPRPGGKAVLEFSQPVENGDARVPTCEELKERFTKFESLLADAASKGPLPRPGLPPRPTFGNAEVVKQIPSLEIVGTATHLQKQRSASIVDQANVGTVGSMLDRVREKVRIAAAADVLERALAEHKMKLRVCEGAMRVHTVLEHLFARIGKVSEEWATKMELGVCEEGATNECEIVKHVCSAQYRDTLPHSIAKASLDCLVEHACGWFEVVKGNLNAGAKYFHRIPGVSSHSAMTSLQVEIARLQVEVKAAAKAVASGPDEAMVAAVAASAPSKPTKRKLPVEAIAVAEVVASGPDVALVAAVAASAPSQLTKGKQPQAKPARIEEEQARIQESLVVIEDEGFQGLQEEDREMDANAGAEEKTAVVADETSQDLSLPANFENLHWKTLQSMCKERGLRFKEGKKVQLVERLRNWSARQQVAEPASKRRRVGGKTQSR